MDRSEQSSLVSHCSRPADSTSRGGTNAPAVTHANVPSGLVFVVDREGKVLYVNRVPSRLSPRDVLSSSIYDFTLPAQHDIVRACLERVFATGRPDGYECSGFGPHGSESWYQCRVVPNDREGERIVSAAIYARDITTWKRTEDELRRERDTLERELKRRTAELQQLQSSGPAHRSEQTELELARFRAIMDQAGEAIFITDPATGRFVDANDTACRWVGRKRAKLLALSINDLDLEFPLQDRNSNAEHVIDTRRDRRPRIIGGGIHRRRNGTYFPVEVAVAERRFGDREYVVAVVREIKDRKRTEEALQESEDKYKKLFNLSHEAIYLSARDGTVADVNQAAQALFGYTREEFVGLEARKLYAQADDIRAFQRQVDRQGFSRDMRVRFVAKDGTIIIGLLSATLRRGGNGEILGYQCLIQPIGRRSSGGHARVSRETVPHHTPAELEAPAPRPAAPPSPPSAAPSAPGTGSAPRARRLGTLKVLVVEGLEDVQSHASKILERAGFVVLTAPNASEAVTLMRAHGGDVGVVILGGATDFALAARELHELRVANPRVRVLRLTREIHPLTLVQQVREAIRTNTAREGD